MCSAAWVREVPPQPERHPLRNVTLRWHSDPDKVAEDVTLNLNGFRGPDFSPERRAGTGRVIFVGDSFTESFGADDEHAVPAVFERRWNEEAAGKKLPPIEAVNLGIGATGLGEYLGVARLGTHLLRPDTVVVILCFNDLPPGPFNESMAIPYREPITPSPFSSRILWVIDELRHQRAPALWYHRGPFPFFLPVPDPSNPVTFHHEIPPIAPVVLEAMRKGHFNPFLWNSAPGTERALLSDPAVDGHLGRFLDALKDTATAHQARLLLAFIPLHATVSDYYYRFWNQLGAPFERPTLTTPEFRLQQRTLAQLTAEREIPFLDLTTTLEEYESSGTHLFNGYDEHMNNEGYTVVGTAIEKTLAGWAPGGRAGM